VLLNLVGNALKFTESGAVVLQAIAAGTAEEPRARFEVTDTGIGISAEAQQRLFTEFTQVEASITRRYGGTGLGLAICKKIVNAMQGEIGVRSELGKGSTFWFEIPFAATAAAPAAPPWQIPAGLTAALIEEHGVARAAVGMLLQQVGLHLVAGEAPAELAQADLAFVHVHHDIALDLIRGKAPAGCEKLPFLAYGSGSLSATAKNFTMIDGALTPSAVVRALAAAGVSGAEAALPAPPPRPAASAPRRSSTSLAILLAEDNAVNQRIAATMLTNMGHTVDIAGNGRDAVAKATLRVYDIIVMDMQMPEMDGLEATRAIRALHGPEGHVPIIAMTANAFAADREACLDAGMNDFVSKPITARKLFDAIEPWANGATVVHAEAKEPEEEEKTPEPEPWAHPDIIDAEQMRMIQEEVGSDELQQLLLSFWADAGGLLNELELALNGDDPARAAAVLHTMKGVAASLGLIGCSHACEDARIALAEGLMPDLDALMTILFKTLQATQPRILEAADAARQAA
jgi:CheY-like chemotaxis protein